LADRSFRVKNGIGIGTVSFADINRNIDAGVTTLGHLKVTGITTVGIISAVDGNGAQGIVTFQSRIGIHSNGKQIIISSPSVGAGYTNGYEMVLPPKLGTEGQTLTVGKNGQLGFTTAGLYEARYYVSALNGDDANDGKSLPFKTLKKAAQAASFRSFQLPGGRYLDAGNLLELNKNFIANEVASFVEFNYPNILSDRPEYDRDTFISTMVTAVEALIYDVSYGGNTKSIETALAYWVGPITFEEETLHGYNYLRFIAQYVINNQTPPTLYQSAVFQTFDFSIIDDPNNINANYFHRRKDSRNLIVNNRQEIIDKSLAAVAIAHSDFYFPNEDQTNERSRYYDSYRLIQQNRQTIVDYAYSGIATAYPSFVNPNPEKCQRDLGYFVDAVSTDVFTGGNNYAREFVFKYFTGVGIGSLSGEEQETIYAFRYAGTLMKEAITNQLPIQDLTLTADPLTGFNTDPASCADVQSNIDTLVGIVTSTIGAGSTSGITTANYGYFAGITTSCNVVCGSIGIGSTNIVGGRKCARDLGYIVDAVAQDVAYGSNQHIVYATKKYFNGAGAALTTGLLGEESQSITAFQALASYAKKAITNQLNVQDLTIVADPVTGFNTDPASCANIQTNIDNLVGILTVAVGNSSLSAVPASGIGTITDCADVRSAINSYVGIITSVIGIGSTAAPEANNPSTLSKPICIIVEAGNYVEDNPILLYEDIAIVGDNLRNTIIRPLNAGKDLFRVRNGCYVTGFAMKDFVDAAGVPQYTFDNAVAYDDPTDATTSRVGYATKTTPPVITRSPYIQNCSILSFLGANGILVDGNKVTTPNVAIVPEEGENPVEGAQPEFGKSMVAAAFTMVSFGGIGWRVINEGYSQVVSCFQIFCRYGSLAQSGGYLSITNSATNFGYYALRSIGWSPNSFVFDRGRVAATGISGGLQTLKVVGVGRTEQDLYVLRFYNNAFADQTANFKPVVTQQTFNATTGINTISDTFLIAAHPFINGDTVLYLGDEGAIPPQVIGGLVSGNQYYLKYIDVNSFQLYEDVGLTQIVNLTSGVVGIHTLQKGNLEFFAKEMLATHNSYQALGIGSTASALNFVSGRQVTQPVTGGTAVGYALTYIPDIGENGQLIVSVEESGGVRRFFAPTGSTSQTFAIQDHSGSPVSVAVTSVVGLTTYHTVDFTVDSTPGGTSITNIAALPEDYQLFFHRPSIVNSSSHTWEYSGSGTDYNALPQNGGKTDPATEQVFELGGRVFSSGTNELGDFKIGTFITAFNRTGNIIFNNKVSIGVLESLRLSLSGGVAVEEFSTDVGLGDNEVGGAKNVRVSTQLAVRTFLNNRLGNFIDKNVSTNAVPSSVVQLNANGQINADLIPPKVVNYYTANVSGGRTDLVNQIPAVNLQNGDTVVEPGNGYVLISDVYGQYLILDSDTRDYNYSNADIVISTSSAGGAIGIVTTPPSNAVGYGTTGLVKGVLLGVNITSGGSGYTNPGVYTCFLDTATGIGTSARATVTVGGGGTVTSVSIRFGGRYYASGDVLSVNDDALIGGRSGGGQFQASVSNIETRLYLQLTNNQKFTGSALLPDYITDGDAVAISTNTSVGYGKTFNPTDAATGGSVDFTNDRIIVGLSTFSDGDPVIYGANGGNVIGGLTEQNTYYTKRVGITSVELYTTYALSSKVDLTASGTGTATLTRVGVNTAVNLITFENHGLGVGDAVRVGGSTPTGITTDSFYYVGVAVTNAFSLHETRTDSLASVNGLILNPVGLADTNGGTFTLTKQNVTYSATVNTSSNIIDNWTVLASGTIDAGNITSGTISPTRLGSGSATDETFLAGDSSYRKVVSSVGIGTTQPLQATGSSFDAAPGGIGINTYYGKVNLTVNRASGTGDTYSTLGVAKFKTSTFSVDADGAVQIKSSANGDVDASTLGGQAGAYYLDPVNFTAAIPISKGGTGLSAPPSFGGILQGNGLTYDLVTSPTFYGNLTVTNNGRISALSIGCTNLSITGNTGIATIQNLRVTNEVVSGVTTFSSSGNNINQTAGTAALNRLTVTGITTVSTLFFESLGGTSGATIPYINNVNTVHTGIVTFTSAEDNIQQQAGTAVLNNLNVSGVSTFVSIVNFGTANFGTADIIGTLTQLNGTVTGVSTFSGSGNNINQTAGTATLNRLTVAGVSTVARLVQTSNETSALQRLTVAGVSTFTGQLNAGTISASTLNGSLGNTLTIQSPLTGTSYNNSSAVTIGINATSANTANYVVQRGASGEFTSGAITATTLTLNGGGSTSTGQLEFTGGTNRWINFGTTGVAAPSLSTRSLGTKLVLYSSVSASSVDYALGINGSTLWYSVPGSSGYTHHWYAGTTSAMTLTNAGTLTVSTDVRAPIYYDSANTGYYLDPASTSILNAINANGVIRLNSDSSYMIGTPSHGFRFNNNADTINALLVNNSGTCTAYADFRAPIFYDSNNTGYYVNPASTSVLNAVNLVGRLGIDNPADYSSTAITSLNTAPIDSYVQYDPSAGSSVVYFPMIHQTALYNSGYRTHTSYGLLKRSSGWSAAHYFAIGGNDSYPTESFFLNYGGSIGHTNGYVIIDGSCRSPIFYDSDNTAYFCDPASRSRFSTLDFGNASYYITAGSWGMRNVTPSGYIEFGPANTSHAHIYTDRSNFYFNVNTLYANGSVIWHQGNDGSGSGLDADLLDGLHAHTGTNNEANKVVRTDGNGYIQAGWINSISGELGDWGNGATRYTASNDQYLRYLTRNSMKVQLGLTGKYDADRRDFTSDSNYFTGIMGWGTTDMNTVMTWGSGFIDSWSNPANQPSGTSHWVGVQAYHYVNAANSGYGWQLVGGPIGNLRFRQSWPNNGSWTTVAMHDRNDGSGGALYAGLYYDSNDSGYYLDPNSTSDNCLRVRGGTLHGPNPTWGKYLLVGGDGRQNRTNDGDVASVCTTNGNLHIDAASGFETYINFYDGNNIYFGNGANGIVAQIASDGTFRSPVFYDYNNTAYYTDPASTSVINALQTAGQVVIQGNFTNNAYNSTTSARLMFGGGNSDAQGNYYIGTNLENYGGNYNKLDLRWHTGIRMGAQPSYGGIRFYDTEDLGTQIFAIGKDGSYAQANQSMRAPIFYDLDNTGYYCDPNSTSYLNVVGAAGRFYTGYDSGVTNSFSCSNWFRSSGATGWFNASYGGGIYMEDSTWVRVYNNKQFYSQNYIQSDSNVRAPIFYDSINTGYYCDPNSTSNLNSVSMQGGNVYGAMYFTSNLGSTSGSLSSPPLQAYSTGNNSAFMSFHKGGYYAVNFGLDSDTVLRIGGWSASANRWQLDMSGNMTAAGNVTAYSDIRLKDNIELIENALEKVAQLNGVTFTRKDHEDKNRRHAGVIAQEIEKVLPEVVSEDNEGIKNVAYGNMVALLIEAIKELKGEIEELKSKISV
jgi:hypothetical protein